jgi:hypothetical protein
MTATSRCPEDDPATLGVDAVSLERYEEMQGSEDDLFVFDVTTEDAWVQSDLYVPRATMR